MRPQRRFIALISAGLLGASAACTLILDRSAEQCANDGECARFGAGSVCVANVCSAPQEKFGQPGCLDPDGSTDYLNTCTRAECRPFDNCGLLGVCEGGTIEPVPPPEGSGGASAAPDSGATALCKDLALAAGLTPIYVTGSSNFPPFLRAFAPILGADQHAVVWQTSNSCAGVDSMYNRDNDPSPPSTPAGIMRERGGRTTEFYYPDQTVVPCLLDGDVPVDVGESDIYADTCKDILGYVPSSPGVGEYLGPIMAMVFVVPGASTQNVISAEAARAVFGRGTVPDPTKLPYTDPQNFFNRAASTATNQIMSRGIGVEPTEWWGVDQRTAGNMAEKIKQVPQAAADKTIGIISTDFADSERGNVKTLAFQATGQSCGFWPDSTPQSEDKINVRDGHYPLWGPLHFFVRVSGAVPESEAAGKFVLRFSATRLDQALVKGIIDSHNVPECAMHVKRDVEMGPMRPFTPNVQCNCFFEKETTGATTCTPCEDDIGCANVPGRPSCNYGYCEPASTQ